MKRLLICAALSALIAPVVQWLIPESQFHYLLTSSNMNVSSIFILFVAFDTGLALWCTLGLWEPRTHLGEVALRVGTAIFAGILFELQVYLIFRGSPYPLSLAISDLVTDVLSVAVAVLAALLIHRYLIDGSPVKT